jgi:1-deoxy-D-xylulose-5-phosphate reductoisomerase
MPTSAPRQRRLILLGSTGSIGTNTLAVIAHLREIAFADFTIVGLAAGSNVETLLEQHRAFGVEHVAIANGGDALRQAGVPHVYDGTNAALDMIEQIAQPGDLVVGAMVGAAGLPATIAAIERGCDIALANKETLVAAGEIVMPLVKKHGVKLLPVDSEHSAVFQCLENVSHESPSVGIPGLSRIVITASGGPFRTWSKDRIENATVEEALNHPTWNMGPKITIDSATMMNKALEVIEAHWLFDLPAGKIETIVHPQSIVHSFVEFVDGSVLAQLGPPDMKTPIQYALTWPERADGCSKKMNWSELRSMDFEPVDHDRFGSIQLAYEVIERGGTSGAIFNAANEAAVQAFLDRRIPFGGITELVSEALHEVEVHPVTGLDDIHEADAVARQFVNERCQALCVRCEPACKAYDQEK